MANWGACEVIEHHQEVETDPSHYITKGTVMQGTGNYEESERAFLNAIKYEASDTQKNQYTANLLSMYYRSGRNDLKKKADRLFDGWWEKRKKELLGSKGIIWMILGICLIAVGGVGEGTNTAVPLFALPLIIGVFYLFNVKRIEIVSLKKGVGKMLVSTSFGFSLSVAATVGWATLLSAVAQTLSINDLPYMVSDSINFGTTLIGILITGMGVEIMLRSVQSDFRKMKEGTAKNFLNGIFTIARIAVVVGTIIALINTAIFFKETIEHHSKYNELKNEGYDFVDTEGYFD